LKKFGAQINVIYPLLDPDIKTKAKRMDAHAVWFKNSSATAHLFNLTSGDKEFNETDEFGRSSLTELGLSSPCILKFMPTKKVLQKLIKRAT